MQGTKPHYKVKSVHANILLSLNMLQVIAYPVCSPQRPCCPHTMSWHLLRKSRKKWVALFRDWYA